MVWYAESQCGPVREENQDVYRYEEIGRDTLALICDGMGGAAGGLVAATLCADAFMRYMRESLPVRDKSDPMAVRRLFSHAVYTANQAVFTRAVESPALSGMGCTLVAVLLCQGQAYFCNVGDSRAYLLRAGGCERLSHDDTYVQHCMDNGSMTPQGAAESGMQHWLTVAMGMGPYVELHYIERALLPGDRVLLCTDGLTGYCPDPMLATLGAAAPSAEACVHALVSHALENGGQDNITALVVEA